MLTRWNDFDRTVFLLDNFRRNFDRLWEAPDFDGAEARLGSLNASWPSVSLSDQGPTFLVQVDLPGVAEKDVDISLHEGVLAIKGSRRVEVPEGYTAHRRERENLAFTRTVTLPARVDPERTTATMKDGVLSIEVTKVPEAQPRKVAVRVA